MKRRMTRDERKLRAILLAVLEVSKIRKEQGGKR